MSAQLRVIAVSSWTLAWSFSAGQAVQQLSNGSYTQSSANVTVANAAYNGSIPAGGQGVDVLALEQQDVRMVLGAPPANLAPTGGRSREPWASVEVATAPAPEQDIDALGRIHQGLAVTGFHPVEHCVDAGYATASAIAASAQGFGIALIGPVRPDTGAVLHPGFAKAEFSIDWNTRAVTCPNGNVSLSWKATHASTAPGNPDPGPRRTGDTRVEETLRDPRRCEATVSETVHAHGLRHCRYKGFAKTHVQQVLTAAGTNIARLFAYDPPDEHPRPARRISLLQRLCQQLATRQAARDHRQHPRSVPEPKSMLTPL